MKLIKPSFEIWEQDITVPEISTITEEQVNRHLLLGIYEQIEKAARVCYKSEDKIKEGSAEKMVNALINSEHYAMLEHGTVYLIFEDPYVEKPSFKLKDFEKYINNPYSKVIKHLNSENWTTYYYVTTNLRVIIENHWEKDLQYLCEPTEYHKKRVTVHFICNRQVSHEFVRHRVFSFAQESTRYCNYSKTDKFGEMTFILPPWCSCNTWDGNQVEKEQYESHMGTTMDEEMSAWYHHDWDGLLDSGDYPDVVMLEYFRECEENYNELIEEGWKPQQAATILPNAIKTELVMTGFISDWKHFFNLRALGTTGKPHPQAEELAKPLLYEFIEKGFIV